jgi:hypothetical protein
MTGGGMTCVINVAGRDRETAWGRNGRGMACVNYPLLSSNRCSQHKWTTILDVTPAIIDDAKQQMLMEDVVAYFNLNQLRCINTNKS